MTRTIPVIALLAALAVPAFALAQETDPYPETNEPQTTETGEAITDTWITTKVKADLLATEDVSGTDINVETKDGVVTLTGSVKSQAEADMAESVASKIEGVTQVDSQLTIEEPTTP